MNLSEIKLYITDGKYEADNLILSLLKKKEEYDYSCNLILSPTKRRSKDLEKKFIINKIPSNQAIIPPTFSTYTDYIYSYTSKKVIADIEVKYLLIESLLKTENSSYDIKAPELIEEILEFYQLMILYYPLLNLSETVNLFSQKIHDAFSKLYISDYIKKRAEILFKIINGYLKILENNNLIDKELLLKNLPPLPRVEALILDSIFFITPTEIKLINHIINSAIEANVFIIENQENLKLIDCFIQELLKMKTPHIIKLSEEKKPQIYVIAKKEKEELISPLENKEKEIRFIAKTIKELAMKGYSIDEMSIILPDPYLYISSIKRIFKNYDIEFNYSFGERILNEAPIQAAFNILKLIEEDFPRDILLFILRSKYFKIPNKKEIIEQIVNSQVIYGADFWEREGKEISEFINKLKRISSKKYLKEFISSFISILIELKFGSAENLNDREEAVIDDFWELLISINNLSENIEIDFTLLKRIIRYLLTQKRYFGKEKISKGVSILGIIEATGIHSEIIFFTGLVDGYEPKIRETYILPEEIYNLLGLPTSDNLIEQQRAHFYKIINSAKKIIFLSYPQLEADKRNIPSLFLQEYINNNSCNYLIPDIDNIVYSKEEYLINLGEFQHINLKDFYQWKPLNQESLTYVNEIYSPEKELNITELLNYYDCPKKFFYSSILSLYELEEPSYDYNAKKWGSLVHEILKESFKTANWQEKALQLLADKIIIYPPPVKEFYTKKFNLELLFLQSIQKEIEEGYKISELEYTITGKILDNDFFQHIKGKIDRLDMSKDGDGFLIIDYKTGDAKEVKYKIQLALYAHLLKENHKIPPKSLLIISLAGAKSSKAFSLNNISKINKLIDTSVQEFKEIILNIRQGNFDVSPEKIDKNDCSKCPYNYLC